MRIKIAVQPIILISAFVFGVAKPGNCQWNDDVLAAHKHELQQIGQQFLQVYENFPSRLKQTAGCGMPFYNYNNTIYSLGIGAIGTGVEVGDRILAINDREVVGKEQIISLLRIVPENASVSLTLARNDHQLQVIIGCRSAANDDAMAIEFLEAVADGNPHTCLKTLRELNMAFGRSALTENVGLHCTRIADPTGYQSNYVSLVYDVTRLAIRELAFVPSAVGDVYSELIIAHIEQLKSAGAYEYASELDRMYRVETKTADVRKAPAKPATTSFKEAQVVSTGTCFVVDPNGKIVTNHHVIGGEDVFVTLNDGRKLSASVITSSVGTDLVVLKVDAKGLNYISLAKPRQTKIGTDVFTIGFPVIGILGSDPKFTDGVISSVSGPQGDATYMQISVPVQPGNSGGPLVNNTGEVVGITTLSAPDVEFLAATGAMPENINWAVKAEYASLLFDQPPRLPLTPNRKAAIERTERALCFVESVEYRELSVTDTSDRRSSPTTEDRTTLIRTLDTQFRAARDRLNAFYNRLEPKSSARYKCVMLPRYRRSEPAECAAYEREISKRDRLYGELKQIRTRAHASGLTCGDVDWIYYQDSGPCPE